MRFTSRAWVALILLVVIFGGAGLLAAHRWGPGGRRPAAAESLTMDAFHRGNTHTHSLPGSWDADSPSRDVLEWYRGQGYAFVALTEHYAAGAAGEHSESQRPGEFRTVPAEEVTFGVEGVTEVHLSALCASVSAGRRLFGSAAEALRAGLRHVASQPGALAQINHPNYKQGLPVDTIAAALDAEWKGRPVLMEIANAHPHARNEGGAGKPSTERIWNELLSRGYRVFGVASDDMHHLRKTRKQLGGTFEPLVGGLGWIQVQAGELEPPAICRALSEGRFYASTGVEYESIRASGRALELAVAPRDGVPEAKWTTTFFTSSGREIAPVAGARASYTLADGETWVRARTCGPGVRRRYRNRVVRVAETCAWTQPHWAP